MIFNIRGNINVINYQYYCIDKTYIVSVSVLFFISLIMFILTRIIFSRILKNYLNHEKFFSDSQQDSKRVIRKSRTNSADMIKIKSEKKMLNTSDINESHFKRLKQQKLQGIQMVYCIIHRIPGNSRRRFCYIK